MQDGKEQRDGDGDGGDRSRPQQGGEGGTTRFGMEEGDNTDVPATGGPTADEDQAPAAPRSR
ncbi:MAG TPA: hypothetical protein VGB08_09970 [Allosphingosinicella sp.]|jgi:hypothetical protein